MNRSEMLARMSIGQCDLLVIGGGISGAGVAREAALRGLRVALVEQDDFASGTSCRSGKMIIGGLRYLLNREFHLVRKGLRERDHLMRMAPHLVQPARYLFPVWEGDPDPLWKIRLGLQLYDLLGNARSDSRHQTFDRASVLELESGLRAEGLHGGAEYGDGMTDDARLALETIQSAVAGGAAVANYARVESFLRRSGQLIGARIRDTIGGEQIDVQARTIVTAAGPWTDFIRRLDDTAAAPLLRLVKGSFVVVPRDRLPVRRNVTFRPTDGRMTFAVPIRRQTYLGTTESDYDGDPAEVAATASDVAYLFAAANRAFPGAHLRADDVISTWAGLRPLVGARPGQKPSQVTRDYTIVRHASGLVVLAGGKLTGFRRMAEDVVDHIFPHTRSVDRALSLAPLPGAESSLPQADTIAMLARESGVTAEWLQEEISRYGCRVGELAAQRPRDRTGETAWLLAQTRHAVKHEMARRLTDVLWRRTGAMIFQPGHRLDAAADVANEMAALLGWSRPRVEEELNLYRREVARMWNWLERPEQRTCEPHLERSLC